MIDVVPWNGGIQSPGPWVYPVCGRPAGPLGPAIVGNQGISAGRADQYYKWLGGQYFVLDGGDGQAPVPPGNYVIRIHVNPPFPCTKFDRAHNRPVDPQGMCHNFFESNYDNNVAEAPITLPPNRPGRTRPKAVGSPAGASTPAAPTSSGVPPPPAASTGRPHASASINASANTSSGRVCTTHVAALYAPTSSADSSCPTNRTSRPSRSACARSDPSSAPVPHSTSGGAGG